MLANKKFGYHNVHGGSWWILYINCWNKQKNEILDSQSLNEKTCKVEYLATNTTILLY